ncbi:unnamed protein product [Cuscuta epithymum]|uniref:Phytocyanin domain-containing protein n=1 Tax=Cuscuta epithymum TaxID=186058 RepID=A0AAV0G6L9_9ASTE|nr:unnamed protein product [Cuscuta epithymum]CAH9143626.1 unnamed protein product [Cuscuta epithymum]
MVLGWHTIAVVLACAALAMLPAVSSQTPPPPGQPQLYKVGGSHMWKENATFNYTTWASGKHFHKGDWLIFYFDKTMFNVLEVNKTCYDSCDSDHFIQNITHGGRDVVQLNQTKTYYFISHSWQCANGMKVAIHVEKPPPPLTPSPKKSSSPPTLLSTFRGHILLPALFTIAAVWDSFLLLV